VVRGRTEARFHSERLVDEPTEKFFSQSKDNAAKDNVDDKSAVRSSTLATRAQTENWILWGLRGGLEQLPRALADNLKERGVEIQTEKKCEKLTFKSDRVELLVNGNPQECSRVISSLCAKDLAELIQGQHPRLSAELKAIPTVTVGVVNLEFQTDLLSLKAFGFLVPPKENLPLLGVLFDSCIFPESSTVHISQNIFIVRFVCFLVTHSQYNSIFISNITFISLCTKL